MIWGTSLKSWLSRSVSTNRQPADQSRSFLNSREKSRPASIARVSAPREWFLLSRKSPGSATFADSF